MSQDYRQITSQFETAVQHRFVSEFLLWKPTKLATLYQFQYRILQTLWLEQLPSEWLSLQSQQHQIHNFPLPHLLRNPGMLLCIWKVNFIFRLKDELCYHHHYHQQNHHHYTDPHLVSMLEYRLDSTFIFIVFSQDLNFDCTICVPKQSLYFTASGKQICQLKDPLYLRNKEASGLYAGLC